jgi:hypothetical protein
VLNGVGSCLIWRNQPISHRRYQLAFLERLVCTSKGHSVPLVYPEEMLFPSIFWKDTIDSSLIGAIPSFLLTDSWQCRKHEFASVMDHLRSRIKNPSLRTSTDPCYIFHAFVFFCQQEVLPLCHAWGRDYVSNEWKDICIYTVPV